MLIYVLINSFPLIGSSIMIIFTLTGVFFLIGFTD